MWDLDLRQDPHVAMRTVPGDQLMLGDNGLAGWWQFNHLDAAMHRAARERCPTARARFTGMVDRLIDLRHPLPAMVVAVIPLLPFPWLPGLRLRMSNRPFGRWWFGWPLDPFELIVLGLQLGDLRPEQHILLLDHSNERPEIMMLTPQCCILLLQLDDPSILSLDPGAQPQHFLLQLLPLCSLFGQQAAQAGIAHGLEGEALVHRSAAILSHPRSEFCDLSHTL